MSEKSAVICGPVGNMQHRAKGSDTRECVRCGCHVWVSPSALAAIQKNPDGIDLLCVPCAMPDMKSADHIGLLPGAKEEISRELGLTGEQIEALMEDLPSLLKD